MDPRANAGVTKSIPSGLRPFLIVIVGLIGASCNGSEAGDAAVPLVRAAVATNFAAAQRELVRRFEATTDVTVETSLGATGHLCAQIENGAPYDIFLAADRERPQRLEEAGLTVAGTRFTYAVGRLVLYAPQWDSVRSGDVELGARILQHFAIANPRTAPYGKAAVEVIEHWGLWVQLRDHIVQGENVGQAFQFVKSHAAEAGLVALSQVVASDSHSYWIVPQQLHRPIRQDAVLLRHGEKNPAARQFLQFLQSDEGRLVIATFGYEGS